MSTVYNWGDRKIWLKIGMIQCIVSLSESFDPIEENQQALLQCQSVEGDRKCAQVIDVGVDANKSEKLKQTKALIF